MALFGFLSRDKDKDRDDKKEALDKGLEKTKEGFFSKMAKAVAGKSTVDEEVLDDVENALISSDVGLQTTIKIIERIEKRVAENKYFGTGELNKILREEVVAILDESGTKDLNNYLTNG